MHIFKGFEDQSDTYHDTRTHYLMEQDPLLLQDQVEVMDVATTNKVEVLKEEKMGPPGPCSSRSGSRYSMSRTCGPRDIISLVIPKVGDTKVHLLINISNGESFLHIHKSIQILHLSFEKELIGCAIFENPSINHLVITCKSHE
jgi:hypothetical protein